MVDPLMILIEQALVTMMTAEPGSSSVDGLFEQLRTETDRARLKDIENRIWTTWCSHADARAEQAMQRVMQGFDAGKLTQAGRELNVLVERWPQWAEAWNKRATLRFIEERDQDSLTDIVETLALEPRHFGALSGLGQICLRIGDGRSALMCFEQVLSVHPSLDSARHVVEALRRDSPEYVQ